MPKYYPFTVVKTVTETIIVEGGGEVTDEKLRYDLPEVHEAPADAASVVASVNEASPAPDELGILAVLLEAAEAVPTPQDPTALAVQLLADNHPAPDDAVAMVGQVAERHPKALDEIQAVVLAMNELSTVPVEDITGTQARVQVNDIHLAATDRIGVEAVTQTAVPASVDAATVDVDVQSEISLAAQDDVSGTDAVFMVLDLHPVAAELIDIDSGVHDQCPASEEAAYTEWTGVTWPDTVDSATTNGDADWLNTGFMTDKEETTQAILRVSSGGLGGLSSQDGDGTLTVSCQAPEISDLDIVSVQLEWGWRSERGGTATGLLGDNINLAEMRYSTDDGSNYTVFDSYSGNGTFTEYPTLDLTAVINGDWNKIDQFRVQCFADITSGAGVLGAAQRQMGFFYARLAIVAEKTYG